MKGLEPLIFFLFITLIILAIFKDNKKKTFECELLPTDMEQIRSKEQNNEKKIYMDCIELKN